MASLMAFEAIAFVKPITFDAPNEITGRIIGPITSGQTEDGTRIKAYHIKTNQPTLLNDAKSSCGTQRIESLPILSTGLNKYKNKKVKLSASIQCIESRLGTYAIDHVYFIKTIK